MIAINTIALPDDWEAQTEDARAVVARNVSRRAALHRQHTAGIVNANGDIIAALAAIDHPQSYYDFLPAAERVAERAAWQSLADQLGIKISTPRLRRPSQLALKSSGPLQRNPAGGTLLPFLPRRPYCTNDLSNGLVVRGAAQAAGMRYVQHNPPGVIAVLVFDVDRPDAVDAWRAAKLPPPNWIAGNPVNGHAHLAYLLAAPVATTDAARRRPINYLAAIEAAYRDALHADAGYTGLICKNPLHTAWIVSQPANDPYSLAALAHAVRLKRSARRRPQEAVGVGRNCTLFTSLRGWSYTAIRDYWKPGGAEAWHEAVRERASAQNVFSADCGGPLPTCEVDALARSIARWTWSRFSPAGFSEHQAAVGRRGGLAKGEAYSCRRAEARALRLQGHSYQEIADRLAVSRRSAISWCK